MWEIEFTSVFAKNLKQLDPQVQRFFLDRIVPKILNNPSIGEKLRGKEYKKALKYKFITNKTSYRLIYMLEKDRLVILMLLIGSTENFY